jgi:hypothetical protein
MLSFWSVGLNKKRKKEKPKQMSSPFQRHRWEDENEWMTETSGLHGRSEQARGSVIILTELNKLPGILCHPWLRKPSFLSHFFSVCIHTVVFKVRVQFNQLEGKCLCFHKDQKFVLYEVFSVLMSWSGAYMKTEMTSLLCSVLHPPSAFRKQPLCSPAISIATGPLEM